MTVKTRHEKSRPLFHMIEENICERTDLSQSAKLAYGVVQSLARSAGHCFASDETIGRKIGVAARQAKRAIQELADACLILIIGTATSRRLRPVYVRNDRNQEDDFQPDMTQKRSEMTENPPVFGHKCQSKTVRNDNITESGEQTKNKHTTTDTPLASKLVVVVDELRSFGLSEQDARALAEEHGAGQCQRALTEAKAKAGTISNNPGWIRACIQRNWTVGAPPREWALNSAAGIDAAINAYGRPAALTEMQRRQRETAGQGDKEKAERLQRIIDGIQAGQSPAEAIEAAKGAV
jgi:hypothetical protein